MLSPILSHSAILMSVLFHVCLCTIYMRCLWWPAEVSGFPGNGVTGCELSCGQCVLDSGPQEEQATFLPAEILPLTSPGCHLTVYAIFYY